MHKLCNDNHCSCYFDSHNLFVQDLPTGRVLYKGLSENGVYPIYSSKFRNIKAANSSSAFSVNKTSTTARSPSAKDWLLWHNRLSHPSARVLHNVFPHLSTCNRSIDQYAFVHCKHCLAGKMHRFPFVESVTKSLHPLHLLHADLWGPAPIVSTNGFRHYLVLVDDFTKFFWVYLLKHKSDTLSTI